MSERAEQVLRGLIPLETYRSPLVPTARFGAGLLLGVAAPTHAISPTPSFWYLVDPRADAIAAFARTAVLSPIPEVVLPVAPRNSDVALQMHPRDAHALLRTHLSAAHESFIAGAELPPALAATLLAAYAVAVPQRLHSWLWTCCSDYFKWLEISHATSFRISGQVGPFGDLTER